MFRKVLFWLHLTCGVTAGLVVLMMSVTGVLLAYERQIMAWADSAHDAAAVPGTARQPLAALLAAAQRERPGFEPTAITLRNEPGSPVTFAAGRSGALLVDPYTATVREPGPEGLREFFDAVEGWHRWFNTAGDTRATARQITGASNLVFLVLVLSGLYLWLPRVWKWAMFRARLMFNAQNVTSKARDFNWHHVFGTAASGRRGDGRRVLVPVGQCARVSQRWRATPGARRRRASRQRTCARGSAQRGSRDP